MPHQINTLIAWLKSQLDKPYDLGANGPDKWDCSSLTQQGFKINCAIDLPRISTDQYSIGTAITKANLQPGDLVFFDTGWSDRKPNHVGIYTGNNLMINANSYNNKVTEENINSSYWTSTYFGARNVFSPTSSLTMNFSDVPNSHPHYTAIKYLFEKGIIKGYPNGTFKPSAPINRAEFLKITLEALPINSNTHDSITNFSDVSADDWFAPYVHKASSLGIVQGYPDGTFKPASFISRAEAMKVILKTSGINLQTVSTINFSDVDKNTWYFPSLNYAIQHNMIQPTTAVTAEPNKKIKRQEVCEALYQIV